MVSQIKDAIIIPWYLGKGLICLSARTRGGVDRPVLAKPFCCLARLVQSICLSVTRLHNAFLSWLSHNEGECQCSFRNLAEEEGVEWEWAMLHAGRTDRSVNKA